jgi:FAD/FMN-containing dehydrogenase
MVPDAVARARDERDVGEILRYATTERVPVTVAGAQSSTTGASITDRGVLMSMRACDRIVDIDPVARVARVQAGALVSDVKHAAAAAGLTWAPDPTSEAESTVGGAIACNASGPRTLWYGPTRRHVHGLRVALADGRILNVRREQVEKNTAGYPLAQNQVDWFIGSEGTLGIVLEAELSLVPRPEVVLGLAVPFESERSALAFVVTVRDAASSISTRRLPRSPATPTARAWLAGRASCMPSKPWMPARLAMACSMGGSRPPNRTRRWPATSRCSRARPRWRARGSCGTRYPPR